MSHPQQIDGFTRDGRPLQKPKPGNPRPDGYAGLPGKGPEGETCGSCHFIARFRTGRRWAKCSHDYAPQWTCSLRTDVLVRSPACQHWQAPE